MNKSRNSKTLGKEAEYNLLELKDKYEKLKVAKETVDKKIKELERALQKVEAEKARVDWEKRKLEEKKNSLARRIKAKHDIEEEHKKQLNQKDVLIASLQKEVKNLQELKKKEKEECEQQLNNKESEIVKKGLTLKNKENECTILLMKVAGLSQENQENQIVLQEKNETIKKFREELKQSDIRLQEKTNEINYLTHELRESENKLVDNIVALTEIYYTQDKWQDSLRPQQGPQEQNEILDNNLNRSLFTLHNRTETV